MKQPKHSRDLQILSGLPIFCILAHLKGLYSHLSIEIWKKNISFTSVICLRGGNNNNGLILIDFQSSKSYTGMIL